MVGVFYNLVFIRLKQFRFITIYVVEVFMRMVRQLTDLIAVILDTVYSLPTLRLLNKCLVFRHVIAKNLLTTGRS